MVRTEDQFPLIYGRGCGIHSQLLCPTKLGDWLSSTSISISISHTPLHSRQTLTCQNYLDNKYILLTVTAKFWLPCTSIWHIVLYMKDLNHHRFRAPSHSLNQCRLYNGSSVKLKTNDNNVFSEESCLPASATSIQSLRVIIDYVVLMQCWTIGHNNPDSKAHRANMAPWTLLSGNLITLSGPVPSIYRLQMYKHPALRGHQQLQYCYFNHCLVLVFYCLVYILFDYSLAFACTCQELMK